MFISDMSYYTETLMFFIWREEVFRKEKKKSNHGDHGRILFPDVPRPSPPRPQKVRLCCCIVELSLSGLDPRTLASCSAYSYIHTHSLPPCAPSRRRRRCCCPQSLATAAASRSSPGLASPNARLISTSVPVPEPRDLSAVVWCGRVCGPSTNK